jgi:hypothetical protein
LAGVGLGATAGTLKIGQGSSGAAACLVAPAPTTRAHISSRTTTCPWPRLPSSGTGQLWDRHVPRGSSSRHQGPRQLRDRHVPRSPDSRLIAQDSSGTATFPMVGAAGYYGIRWSGRAYLLRHYMTRTAHVRCAGRRVASLC